MYPFWKKKQVFDCRIFPNVRVSWRFLLVYMWFKKKQMESYKCYKKTFYNRFWIRILIHTQITIQRKQFSNRFLFMMEKIIQKAAKALLMNVFCLVKQLAYWCSLILGHILTEKILDLRIHSKFHVGHPSPGSCLSPPLSLWGFLCLCDKIAQKRTNQKSPIKPIWYPHRCFFLKTNLIPMVPSVFDAFDPGDYFAVSNSLLA